MDAAQPKGPHTHARSKPATPKPSPEPVRIPALPAQHALPFPTTPHPGDATDAAPTPDPDDDPASLVGWCRHALAPYHQAPARHHRLLLGQLDELADGKIDRLMVLMPPGSAKSTYASVLFPAWWFTRHPRSSIIATSHTAGQATLFGRRARAVVSEHAETLDYRLLPASRAAAEWTTTEGGEYYATGIGGPITGRRADLVLVDDPVKSHFEADSAARRDALWEWWCTDLATRLKPDGKIALIMTRWHEDDIGGRLIDSDDGWRVLSMPAINAEGQALWPEWESLAKLERRRATMATRRWQALYQQQPAPDTGSLFTIARISVLGAEPPIERAVRAWDFAATAADGGRDPDWTVGLKLGRDASGRCTVLDVVRLRGGPHDVEQAVVATAASDGTGVTIGLPQDPGQAGKTQVAWLAARLAGHRVIASPETGSKFVRAAPVASQADAGNLAVLAAGWNRAFLDELRDFPHGRKDDQVDALSRAFSLLAVTRLPARRLHIPFMGR